ncbi:MAG: DUF1501 domain-containing protein [Planctomycetaceae bacterium]|nr:DUF1501 domain-containing protein [Planctomycetales bacterium]MCB9926582.1 DUF1501 domain-containing protein [Planctomycetaceae bacterium]
MTRQKWFCGSSEHAVSRRSFLGSTLASTAVLTAADMTVLDALQAPAVAEELKRQDKRVILFWLAGGASQLETWDPKPGRPTGGPYRAIQTNVPGIHISELMPKMSQRLQKTSIIRSLNTKIGDHGGGATLMHLGRRDESALRLPDLGAMIAREMGRIDSAVPDYVAFYTATEGRGSGTGTSGFLGARYAPMFLTTESKPANLALPPGIEEIDHHARADLRELLSNRFAQGRKSSSLGSHNEAYARVRGLMSSEHLFDISGEPQSIRDMYGPTLFGEQTLVARRLIEAGTPFVKVSRAWWDSHGQNFETHLELVTELDHVMSGLLDDLDQRGLLDNTLVITMSEFGRTPNINASLGRDHFASAWSVSLTGCGIKGGSVYGKSDEDGQTVADGEIGAPELFATIFEALGIDHEKEYYVGVRPVPLTEPGAQPLKEVIA